MTNLPPWFIYILVLAFAAVVAALAVGAVIVGS